MRRNMVLHFAIFLSLITLSSAQQPTHPSTSGPQSGSGLAYIQNGTSPQSANFNITGNGTVAGTLQGNLVQANQVNNFGPYQIGGKAVLTIGQTGDDNVFVGVGSGVNNTAGQGQANTFLGSHAGNANTTGNTNTFLGLYAGTVNTTGNGNTFAGSEAGFGNNTGSQNSFFGTESGLSTGAGNWNAFFGSIAGFNNTSGSNNTFLGSVAGYYNTTGSDNLFLGTGAGYNNSTGSNDVYIANGGIGTESNTIRIGTSGTHSAAYVAGIYGKTSASGVPVFVNSNGQLGTQTSSRRFKEQINDMGDSTDALMKLRPVTFLYKPEYADGDRTLQYGLIAEEVAEVYPDLVSYEQDGKTPYTVRYQYLASMLLNEFQKQYHHAEEQGQLIESQQKQIEGQRSQIEAQRSEIAAQSQQIENLKQELQLQNASLRDRLSKLESLVRTEVAVAQK